MSASTTDVLNSESSPVNDLDDVLSRSNGFQIPRDITAWMGTKKPIWMILRLVALVCDRKMVDRTCGQTPPSCNTLTVHEARNATVRRSTVEAELFLTRDALNLEVEITGPLFIILSHFMLKHSVTTANEPLTTKTIIAPIIDIFLAIWSRGSQVEFEAQWSTQSDKPSQARGDVDVAVQCTLDSGAIVEAAVLESKTPRSCGHPDVLNVGLRVCGNENGMAIGHQMAKHSIEALKIMRLHWDTTARQPILGGLVVYPAHFYPSAYRNMDLVVFQNVIAATEPAHSIWPEAVNHLENGFRFVEVLAAWTLAVLVNADSSYSTMWASECAAQVEQARGFLLTSGEQLAGGGHYIASLMRLWATLCNAIHQVAVSLLVATTKIPRFRAVQLPNGRRLIVESGGLWVRFPFDMCLPHPDACHESEQGKTYVFYLAKIIVKIILNPESYSKEVSFYREWAGLQGSGIPRLLARGKCFGDDLPFLIISNEGTRLAKITKEDQDTLEKTVIQTLHRSGWHHHDLAARNVVRNPSGKLCLIDFGEAEHCERDGCQDLWQSE